MSEQRSPAQGWYPDTQMVNTQRFWDGSTWTDQTMPLPQQPQRDSSTLEVLGWIGAFVMPLAGFIIGCVLSSRPGKGTSAGLMIVVSIGAALFWFYVVSSAMEPDTVTYYRRY